MSIYSVRRKPAAGKQPEHVSGGSDAPQIGKSAPEAPAENRAWMRKAHPVEYMLPATVTWFEALPPEVRPVTLAAQYARIANLLAQQWNDDKACRAYFDELLTGRRGKRRGFPVNVRREIWVLREYYQRICLRTEGDPAIV
jgi:hypothetical protein